MTEMKEYQYEFNLKDIKLNFNLTYTEKEISIKLKEENNLNEIYEASFTLSYLIETNNIFKIFNATKDCYDYLVKLINNKKFKINKETNKLSFIFIVKNLITENEEEIKISLNPKILDINKIIENYGIIIKDLKNENIGLKNEISILKDEVNNLKNIANEYKSFKENINSIIDERIKLEKEKEKKEVEKENQIFHELNYSSILTSLEEKMYFQNLIKCQNLKLLYRLTRDGSKPEDFHRLCDNKGPTLTIFKSENNRKFGGYLSKNWESKGHWKNDNNVFLFSIDLKKKYKIENNKDSYYCYDTAGPIFQGLGFYNYGNLLEKNKFCEYDLRNNYELNEGYNTYEISGNDKSLCKDIEVYEVKF